MHTTTRTQLRYTAPVAARLPPPEDGKTPGGPRQLRVLRRTSQLAWAGAVVAICNIFAAAQA